MIAVYRPKDLDNRYKKIIDNAIRDLSPDTKENIIKLFNTWRGSSSEKELSKLVGLEKANNLIRKLKESDDADLTEAEQNALKDIFKDSLTFD
jgi:hypothetical protein